MTKIFIVKPAVIEDDGTMREKVDSGYPAYPLTDGAQVPTSFEVDGERWELLITVKKHGRSDNE
jgi:hypothetical protein